MNVVPYHRTLRIARNRRFGLRLAFAAPGSSAACCSSPTPGVAQHES
jgi:hypothetical protein